MKETLQEYGKYIIGVAIICYILLSIFFKNNSVLDNIEGSISLTLLFCYLYAEYIWKYIPIDKTPKIYGDYKAVFISEYDGKKRKANITIKQNLISTRIYMKTNESKSESTTSTLIKKEDSWQLIYTYTNIPNANERNHSEIHFGTCILDIIDNKIINGNYYTDRKTAGDINNINKISVLKNKR